MTTHVEQVGRDGSIVRAPDTRLSTAHKDDLLLAALPGAVRTTYAGVGAVLLGDQVILRKQVTHLGNPWPGFKKRIQIPGSWLEAERRASAEGLKTRFMGIYHHDGVTVFVDFDPTTYVTRKANNSAAHVSTNDLFQAQTLGQFARTDRNGNRLTSIRADQLESYLRRGFTSQQPLIDVFRRFAPELLHRDLEALDAVKEMHAAAWPDTFQGEWPGFYVEYRLDAFLRREGLTSQVQFQKMKSHGLFDYDLVFRDGQKLLHFGDLKASDVKKSEAPGNDAADIKRCIDEFGRFWYVIYEHETRYARDHGDVATVEWNEWKRSVGYTARKEFDPLSYSRRFKAAVRFVRCSVLEVNPANFAVVLGDFAQGQQPGGAPRALKVMIKKKNIDNFLIYTEPTKPRP